jgi:hypothetical protein
MAKKVRNLKVRTQDDRRAAAVVGGDRALVAKSNIAGTYNKTADALVANIRG